MRVILLRWAQYAGPDLRYRRFLYGSRSGCRSSVRQARRLPYNFLTVKLRREFRNALLPFAACHLHSLGALCISWSRVILSDVAFNPFHFGVRAAGLLHFPHISMRAQFGFGASLQLTVKSLVVSVQLRD